MAEQSATDNTSVKAEGKEIIVYRVFNAPLELVWEAWTNRKHVEKWWGPKGFSVSTHEMDVRKGGVWRFDMQGPDSVRYPNKITYTEVKAPSRLVYTSTDGTENDPGMFQTTVTFTGQGNRTEVTMRMAFQSKEALEKAVKEYGAMEGAVQTLGRLEEQLKVMF